VSIESQDLHRYSDTEALVFVHEVEMAEHPELLAGHAKTERTGATMSTTTAIEPTATGEEIRRS